MKHIHVFLIIIFAAIVCELNGQGFINYTDKTYGTSKPDYFRSAVIQNGYIYMAGHTTASIDGDKTDSLCTSVSGLRSDVWIIKTDLQLNKIWDKSIGGNRHDITPSLFINSKGQIVITSISESDSSCDKTANCYYDQNVPSADYWIIILDTNGNVLWDRTFGGSMVDSHFPKTIELPSGNYITCGISTSPVSYDKTIPNWGLSDYWCVKYDSAGNKIWDQVFGGNGQEYVVGYGNYGNFYWLLAENDDAFIIAGTTGTPLASGNISQNSFGTGNTLYDAWFIKIDSSGNKVWDWRYGGSHNDIINSFIKTDDGFVAVGFTASNQGGSISQPLIGMSDVWVLKLDTLGNKLWDRRFGGIGEDRGVWIDTAFGGGYLISGMTDSPQGFDLTEPPYSNLQAIDQSDYWIFKIDTAGIKLWDKRYGGPGTNSCYSLKQISDSSIYLFGIADSGTTAVKTDPGKGGVDYWIVHFKYTDGPVGVNESEEEVMQLTVFPNPATETITLQHSIIKTTGHATVYNVLGEAVHQLTLPPNSTRQQLNIAHLPAGLYLIKVEADGKSGVKRFMRLTCR